MQINIAEAKKRLSELIKEISEDNTGSIVIARYGEPVAVLSAYKKPSPSKRIGVGKGIIDAPNNLDQHNDEIEELFGGTF